MGAALARPLRALRTRRERRRRTKTASAFRAACNYQEECTCSHVAPEGTLHRTLAQERQLALGADANAAAGATATAVAAGRPQSARPSGFLRRLLRRGGGGKGEAAAGDAVDLWGPHLYGSRKFLGGAVDTSERYLYGVPSHAKFVLKVDTHTGEVRRLHEGRIPGGRFKWLRGVRAANGCVYCIPACANCVLKIDPADDSISFIGKGTIPKGDWKWHGGSLARSDGNIYCIPANANRVLRIEPATDSVSLHGPDLTDFPGAKNKWYGGIKGRDGSIWGIPYNATRCLKIVPASEPGLDDVVVKMVGPEFQRGGWKWHGGTADRVSGAIWGVSSHYDGIMKITPEAERVEVLGAGVVGGGKYKFGGAVADSEGNVWCLPSDTTYALRVAPGGGPGGEDAIERVGQLSDWSNKWQGGVLVPGAGDGGGDAVYAIPCDATQVLKIHCATRRLELLGHLPVEFKKFQGAYGAADGSIWALPESARHILRIRPERMSAAPHVPAGHTEDDKSKVNGDGACDESKADDRQWHYR